MVKMNFHFRYLWSFIHYFIHIQCFDLVTIQFYYETCIFNSFHVVLSRSITVNRFCRVSTKIRSFWPRVNFVTFLGPIKLQKRNSHGVLFQLFLDSQNMEILSSTCIFKLVKVNEKTHTQYKFNPFPDSDKLLTKKEYLSWTWLRGSLKYCFMPFRTQETIYEKERLEFYFSPLFQTL